MIHCDILVSGKVQGVFYRATTVEKANEFGLKGFAQNLPDGRVYIEAEGEMQAIQFFIEWCKKGPPRAFVTSVAVTESELKNYSDFSIKR